MSFISVLSIFSLYLAVSNRTWVSSIVRLTARTSWDHGGGVLAMTIICLNTENGNFAEPTELANWYIIGYIWAHNNIWLPNYYDILEKCYKYRKFKIQLSQIMFFWYANISDRKLFNTWSSGNSRPRSTYF